MAEESSVRMMNVELAIQRELEYRRKIFLLQMRAKQMEADHYNDFEKGLVPLQVQSSSQVPSPSRNPSSSPPPSRSPRLSGMKEQSPTSSVECLSSQQPQPLYSHPMHANQIDNVVCSICHVPCTGTYNYKQHIHGRKHKAKLRELKLDRNNVGHDGKVANQKRWCKVCKVSCMDENAFKMHLNGKRHYAELQKVECARKDALLNSFCHGPCSSAHNYKQHIHSHEHNARLQEFMLDGNSVGKGGKVANQQRWCEMCKVWCIDENSFNMHLNGKKHKAELQKVECARKGGEIAKQQKWCGLCELWCPNEDAFKMHLEGKTHVLQLHEIEKKKGAGNLGSCSGMT